MTEGCPEQPLDLSNQGLEVSRRRAEDYIAARDVGPNVAKAGASESSGQRFHFDQLITADIDTAEKGYVLIVSRHRRIIVRVPGIEKPLLNGGLREFAAAAVRVANDRGEIFNRLTPVTGKT